MTDDSDDGSPVTRAELEAAVRFLHVMGMQTKLALERVDAQLDALAKTLVKSNLIEEGATMAELPEARKLARERSKEGEHVKVGPAINKYGVSSPEIDCHALIPICQARCCRLTVYLSFQDLDDGLRWEYARPYELRRREIDGYCVYSDPQSRSCGMYRRRPAVCRSYDCRADPRVWLDFENRIPAPLEACDSPLIALRNNKTKPSPR